MTDRKKPGVAFWATVALVVLVVGYPMNFGPACWLASHTRIGRQAVATCYYPLIRCWADGPQPLSNVLDWWMRRNCASEWHWAAGSDGAFHWVNVYEGE